jgi:hypothetical protein
MSLSSGLQAFTVFYFCGEKMPQFFNFPNTTILDKKGQWNRSLGDAFILWEKSVRRD